MCYRLDELFELQMGKTPSRNNLNYWENGTNQWISIGDLSKAQKYISTTKEQLTELAILESGIKSIPEGTVIMSFKLSIGKVAITTEPIFSNEAIMAFLDRGVCDIDPEYFYYYLKSRNWDLFGNKAVMGLTLNKKTLSQMTVDICPIEEQRLIVTNLKKLESIITSYSLQISKLDLLVKSRFVEMFGDLANPNCKWEKSKLSDICSNPDDIKCGPFGTQLGKEEYTSKGVAVWEIPQINSEFTKPPTHFVTKEKAQILSSYTIKPGDIAMSRKGNVGKCAIFPDHFDEGIIHSDVLRIRVDDSRVNPTFLMRQLHYSGDVQHQIELVSSGAIMAGINVAKLKNINIYIPPKYLQDDFSAFVKQTNKSKAAVQKSLDEAQLLFDSLMQEYFG